MLLPQAMASQLVIFFEAKLRGPETRRRADWLMGYDIGVASRKHLKAACASGEAQDRAARLCLCLVHLLLSAVSRPPQHTPSTPQSPPPLLTPTTLSHASDRRAKIPSHPISSTLLCTAARPPSRLPISQNQCVAHTGPAQELDTTRALNRSSLRTRSRGRAFSTLSSIREHPNTTQGHGDAGHHCASH